MQVRLLGPVEIVGPDQASRPVSGLRRKDGWPVPNLDFYAADGDWPAVLHAVFDSNVFRVLEAHSRPGHDLREFHGVREAVEAGGRHLMLFVTNAGPAPIARRR